MFYYTIFAGSEARMTARGFTAVTLFGGAELTRPTLAQRILARETPRRKPENWWERLSQRDDNFVFTLFGSTEIIEPTLMEEYAALRGLISTGSLNPEVIRNRLRELLSEEGDRDLTTLTIFGGFSDQRPKRSIQVKALDDGERAGIISNVHRRRLDDVVDATPTLGAEVLGDLVAELAAV